MSFLPHYCHSFRIMVLPSRFLSFLPDFCHSFRIEAIGQPRVPMADLTEVIKLIGETFEPKKKSKKYFTSFLPGIIVIPSGLWSFLPDFCHSFRILVIPSVLKLLNSQEYLWLSYDLAEVIKLIEETFEPKRCFKKKSYVIPSTLLSFLPKYSENYKY